MIDQMMTQAADDVMDQIRTGLALLEEERSAFLTGAYGEIAGICARKGALLDKLEPTIRMAPRNGEILALLNRLIQESRRNEQIIEAARQGLAQARRRVGAIRKAEGGAVAYAEDGTTIACAGDSITEEKSA